MTRRSWVLLFLLDIFYLKKEFNLIKNNIDYFVFIKLCNEYNELSATAKLAIYSLEGDMSMGYDPIREYGDNREKKGRQEGVVNGVASSLLSLMKRMNLTEKQAMDTLDIPQSEREMYSKRLSTLI